MPTPPVLPQERFRALLQQLRAEGKSQDAIADIFRVHQTMVSMVLRGEREAGIELIWRAHVDLHIGWEFFTDGELRDPQYREHVKRGRPHTRTGPVEVPEKRIKRTGH